MIMNEKEFTKRVSLLVICLFYLLVILSFVLSPVTGDIKVFLAGAKQADFLNGNFIQKVYNQWELKGVFNRMTFYVLYKTVSLFCDFPSIAFERFASFYYWLFSTLVLFFSAHLFISKKGISNKIILTMILSLVCLCVQIMSRMQAEMSVCIILIFAFSLYVNAEITKKSEYRKLFIAGILIGITFFFKTVLILLAVSFVAGCYIWDRQNETKPTIKKFLLLFTGGLLSLVLGIVSILLINPQEIQNMLDASLFQSTLFSGGGRSFKGIIAAFGYGYLNSSIGAPFILLGLISAIFVVGGLYRQKKIDCLFMELVVWGIPSIIIILANNYFYYHFYIFTLPSLLNLYLVLDRWSVKTDIKNRKILLISLSATILCSLILQFGSSFLYVGKMNKIMLLLIISEFIFTFIIQFIKFRKLKFIVSEIVPVVILTFCFVNYLCLFSQNTRTYTLMTKQVFSLNKGLNFDKTKTTLYLDDGSGAYYWGNKSYSNYYYPLPLQRIYDASEKANSEFYKTVEASFLAFDGEYIITQDDWFFQYGNNAKLKQKLADEYEEANTIFRWSVPQSLFIDFDKMQPTELHIYQIRK